MPATDTLDMRMRSVDSIALKAATEFSGDRGLSEARRNAAETIALVQEKYERAGAQIESPSATIRANDTAIRSEVIMSLAAADELFGNAASPQFRKLLSRESRSLNGADGLAQSSFKDASADELVREFVEGFTESRRLPLLPVWMEEIIRMDQDDHSDAALDELFDQMDRLFSMAEYSKVDELIAAMPVEGPSLTLMMGLLSITCPAREHLRSRAQYFERVYRLCKAMRRDAESLLGGLR